MKLLLTHKEKCEKHTTTVNPTDFSVGSIVENFYGAPILICENGYMYIGPSKYFSGNNLKQINIKEFNLFTLIPNEHTICGPVKNCGRLKSVETIL